MSWMIGIGLGLVIGFLGGYVVGQLRAPKSKTPTFDELIARVLTQPLGHNPKLAKEVDEDVERQINED